MLCFDLERKGGKGRTGGIVCVLSSKKFISAKEGRDEEKRQDHRSSARVFNGNGWDWCWHLWGHRVSSYSRNIIFDRRIHRF